MKIIINYAGQVIFLIAFLNTDKHSSAKILPFILVYKYGLKLYSFLRFSI